MALSRTRLRGAKTHKYVEEREKRVAPVAVARDDHERYSSRQFAQDFRGFASETPDFHDVWYERLDDPLDDRLLLLAPREHAKSSVVMTYVMKEIAENRQIRAGILSQSGDLAKAFMREVKYNFENNQKLINHYGEFKNPDKWSSNEILVRGSKQSKDVTLFALGSGAQATGRHADLLIFDDVESLSTVKTQARRATTKAWFSRELVPVLSPGGKIVVVGSRKHFDDLYGSLLPADSGWSVIDNALAAILTDGTPLWKDRWTLKALLARKRQLDSVDIRAWSQEYLNQPIAGETQMFQPDKWPRYVSLPAGLRIYQGYDLAISERTSSDFTVCVTIGVDSRKNVYLLNVARGHWTINMVKQNMVRQFQIASAMWGKPESIAVEMAGFQAPIVRDIIADTHLPIRGIKPPGDKIIHARYMEARASAGLVYAPSSPTAWWGDYARELLEFPAGAHDDQVDASSYVLDEALPLSGWMKHFDEEMAAVEAGGAETELPSHKRIKAKEKAITARVGIEGCAFCTQALGDVRYTSDRLYGAFCSSSCMRVAERIPVFAVKEVA